MHHTSRKEVDSQGVTDWKEDLLCVRLDQETPLSMENGAASDSKDPSSFLSEIIGAPVTVKLNSSVVYKGDFFPSLIR